MRFTDPRMPGPNDPEAWPEYCGHPNDPRAPADDTAEKIAAEADAIMAECSEMKSAYDFAFNWEALIEAELRAPIIQAACAGDGSDGHAAHVGRLVITLVRSAAMARAAHELSMRGS